MHERENALKEWLGNIIKTEQFSLEPLAGDASFRRYFRLQYNGISRVVMDAPPGKEDLTPFIHVTNLLAHANILVPEILAINQQQGFLLLSDFGDQLLLKELQPLTVDAYYKQAINLLFKIQNDTIMDEKIPNFDKAFMLKEMSLCTEWFFNQYLSLELSQEESEMVDNTMHWIAEEVAKQPLVLIHRDFHSRNLMLVHSEQTPNLGVIDFQDAMRGPITYDLVSLLKDCYISWPREKVLDWVGYFHMNCSLVAQYSDAEIVKAFDLCGLQRHLKVLGVFSRLHLRDNKPGYLKDLPLTLTYVLECTELYPELLPLCNFLQKRVYLP